MSIGSRRDEEESQIDLTPMLDVVFIMLIFFIVTATFIDETTIAVQRPPSTEQPPSEENKNIVFSVSATGDITLAGRRIDIRSVRANVERLRAENPEAKVIVAINSKAKTEVYIRIADQAREAGIHDISLAIPDND
ncbi:MAG: biopolymer transporter ExbD [Cycloclasticus sp.]|jgi:biopolymer transport protein ExbD|nr:biopolymer transporter ExbD [Cycloclasticus sp.]HIL92896.1 biopolymer transporter ExbD [Cycloclasticus sp.]